MLTRKQLLALDNMSLIMKASQDGLKVFPEDLIVNYAEIDLELNRLEKDFAEKLSVRMLEILLQYAKDLQENEKKTGEESGLAAAFSALFMDFIRDVWAYGQGTADQELSRIEQFAERPDLTNNDAFEWYQLYSKALGKHQETAVFHYMQPLILEHLDAGTVRTGLADDLAASFAQYGPVRAAIIARTESNKAFNWGRRYRFDKSQAIAGYRYSAILDERTTEICRALHGHSWTIDDPELDAVTPCNHYQCRSILVPISKYVSHTWSAPAAGWEKNLPDKDREVFDRFRDSSFYPKAESVKAGKTPTMAAPKKQAAPPAPKKKKKDPAPAPILDAKGPDDPRAAADQLLRFSHEQTIREIQGFIDHNVKNNGASKDHPVLKLAAAHIDNIKNGVYDGKMITGDYNSRSKKYEIYEYTRMNNIFWRVKSSNITAAEKRRMLDEIQEISLDPLFSGVKIDLIKSKTVYGSYNVGTDILRYTPEASQSIKRSQVEGGHLGTLWHEIGHRVHGTKAVYPNVNSAYMEELAALDLAMSDDLWKEWEQITDSFWETSFTKKGSQLLPADLYDRYDYPINAQYYYDKGTKANFYREMFAETSSVYLEGNLDEISKVSRTYPGILDFMERLYKRGMIKGGD